MNATISEKGWVVIPSPLRKKYNLQAGVEVQVIDYGGVLAIVPEISQKPGFKSLHLLKDVANNKVFALVLWETEADAHASMDDFQQRRAKIAEFLSGPPSVEMLEVV